MLSKSFDYLRSGTDWERTVIIGGVLSLLSFLLVPAFVVTGYLLRVLRATMHGDAERPPVFDDWTDMTVDGLKGYLIALVYGLVPTLAFVATVGFGFTGLASGTDAGAVTGGLVLLVGGLLTFALALAVAYVLPAAILNYAETGRLGAGFDVGSIAATIVTRAYVRAFAYAMVVVLSVGLVAGLLNAIPFVGAVVGAFLGFYASVMVAYVYGVTYAEMHPVETTDGETVDERAAV